MSPTDIASMSAALSAWIDCKIESAAYVARENMNLPAIDRLREEDCRSRFEACYCPPAAEQPDGTVEGEIENASEAGRVFVESIRQHLPAPTADRLPEESAFSPQGVASGWDVVDRMALENIAHAVQSHEDGEFYPGQPEYVLSTISGMIDAALNTEKAPI